MQNDFLFNGARNISIDPQQFDPTQESKKAFEQAISDGRLSDNPKADNYAGKYMYMGKSLQGSRDAFKNIMTRQYLK